MKSSYEYYLQKASFSILINHILCFYLSPHSYFYFFQHSFLSSPTMSSIKVRQIQWTFSATFKQHHCANLTPVTCVTLLPIPQIYSMKWQLQQGHLSTQAQSVPIPQPQVTSFPYTKSLREMMERNLRRTGSTGQVQINTVMLHENKFLLHLRVIYLFVVQCTWQKCYAELLVI